MRWSAIPALVVVLLGWLYPGPGLADGFHRPQTAAELAVDTVLALAEREDRIVWFATGWSRRDKTRDARFARYFTEALIRSWRSAEADAVTRNCAGRYVEGEMCGIDVHPITCAQDASEGGYLYRTESFGPDVAVISYRWPQSPEPIARYRMIRSGNAWLMDGVACRSFMSFNMK